MRSRVGRKPSARSCKNVAVISATPALLSSEPRPKKNPFSSIRVNGSRSHSARRAGTTSMCASSRIAPPARAVAPIAHGKRRRGRVRQHVHVFCGKAAGAEAIGEIARHRRRLPTFDRRVERRRCGGRCRALTARSASLGACANPKPSHPVERIAAKATSGLSMTFRLLYIAGNRSTRANSAGVRSVRPTDGRMPLPRILAAASNARARYRRPRLQPRDAAARARRASRAA